MDVKNSLIFGQTGKITNNKYTLDNVKNIESVDAASIYKYLGVYQDRQIDHKEIKRDNKMKFKYLLNMILIS